ncbi:beta-ketoacyl-ACP synthase II [Candidatus Lucifugimonas marina]|jgi:3-oxoacyl-[acyl-carrier-protein] synthase II|uniref:3-oxoacyl-[acyl-carrier-protein] synthase 2 n=1 Tax=Candidatus Lucifugimonas marina TaxID=3038979 RepID=A0AAJ5ZFR3_9CHLR|nr:beta-ketoacyl-ACP synthase II [SAR202 cluster bacterium JH702]MDG0868689.1 beta-ketoacyl-ACP synthase II [SAR202 cluster bacterium JH639]WFG35320.1 beta-ketoacyl-ACP synthase II [SAR202 cluster bacterium JH545]WFG39269.1 beta-ketoacyl-ACP synthase II [SAR202 cluster bacterium JH1073]
MTDRVVVTGIGLVTPVGSDSKTTWNSLLEGKSGIDYISLFDAEGFESRIAAEVNDFDGEGILGRKEARRLDRFSQFACVAALEALEDAGIDMATEDADRVGVLIGSGVGGIMTISEQHKVLLNRGPKRVSPFLVPMMLGDMASGQVSMMIGAKGPNFSTVSACATGTDSIGEALEMIRRGRADVVIAGGTEAAVCEIGVAGFNACMALSTRNDDPQAASRPFDTGRDGFVLGEGAGVIVLESLEHAEKRGANVLAEMAGYGASSDAHHVTQPHPEGEGAARAMKWAIEDAGLVPENVDYVNAHGTSTPLNDKFETIALKRMYGDHAYNLAISSTKSMTGHLLGAAGGIEAAFSVLTVKEGIIPPTINVDDPDPECDLNYVPNKAVEQKVDVAMSNSLGFGGHNASLVFKSFQQ